MKFTHKLYTNNGWVKTSETPSDFKDVKHLGKCKEDGDMFVGYDEDGHIEIYKGTMEEETLKTNTWYRHREGGFFLYRTGDKNNYVIDFYGDEDFSFPCSDFNAWIEAPEEEVREALVKLAKKKGFKNINELRIKSINGNVFEKGFFNSEENNFRLHNNILSLDGVEIFKNGKWAEILEEKQPLTILGIEERLKRLEDKLL